MEAELEGTERGAMEGVLGVEAVGASIDVRAETEVVAELQCDSPGSCAAVNDLVARKQRDWAANPLIRILGLGQAADALSLSLNGSRLELRTRLATEDLRSALARALAWRKSRAADEPARAAVPAPATPASSSSATPPPPSSTDAGAQDAAP
jgi:hypothetical protein